MPAVASMKATTFAMGSVSSLLNLTSCCVFQRPEQRVLVSPCFGGKWPWGCFIRRSNYDTISWQCKKFGSQYETQFIKVVTRSPGSALV